MNADCVQPVNSAFGMLPAGTVDTLLKPENKMQLTSILTYHVVPMKALRNAVHLLSTQMEFCATFWFPMVLLAAILKKFCV